MEEIRKDVIGYEWLYIVSNLWNIKSLKRKIINWKWAICIMWWNLLKPQKHNSWYLSVWLSNKSKVKYVLIHRIVAQAFIENYDLKRIINHIDWNKHNNNVSNLEWCTYSENLIHSYKILWRIAWMKWRTWYLCPNYKFIKV
jgi:hypothetical protein